MLCIWPRLQVRSQSRSATSSRCRIRRPNQHKRSELEAHFHSLISEAHSGTPVLTSPQTPLSRFNQLSKKLLLLSHGQASVERGFSVNKEVEAENMQEDTIVTHRLICDYVTMHGGVTQVPLTKELLASVGAARSKYRLFLDQERIRKEKESQSQKRKLTEQSLEDLKKRKKSLEDVSTCLAREADSLAEEAEGKAGSKMAQLLSKSNALRRAYKEKLAQVKILETEIGTKKEELRHM
ncbi:hypothetical protein SRHO_G00327460 [Serrasalmus rhombeus]